MRPEVRDAINNINRLMQETKFIDVSSNKEEVRNAGQPDEYVERYYYLSDKFYTDIDEFKKDFLIP